MIPVPVTIVGLGGIGSWTAQLIARLGCPVLTLYDDDTIEAHNLENQNYEPFDIGRPKVVVTARELRAIAKWHTDHGNPMRVVARNERATEETRLSGIVIVAVDTVEARKAIFAASSYREAVPLYIEAGAAEDQGSVRVFVPHNKDHVVLYEKLLRVYSEDGPPACVSPYMGGQFATAIAAYLMQFAQTGIHAEFMETEIDYREHPIVTSDPLW